MSQCSKGSGGKGTVTGDTHAANLTGAYVASTHSYTPSSDSHGTTADTLQKINTGAGGSATTLATTCAFAAANYNTETTLNTVSPSVTGATNQMVMVGSIGLTTISSASYTLRIKESSTVLFSQAGNASAGNKFLQVVCTGTLVNVSTGSHTYTLTIQGPNGAGDTFCYNLTVQDVYLSGSYSASSDSYVASTDTHAASLTGSSGSCA